LLFRTADPAGSVVQMGRCHAQVDPELLAVAAAQGGFVDFPTLRRHEVRESEQRAHVAAGRWLGVPRRGVVLLQVVESVRLELWRMLVAVGPGARLGGVSALAVDGLTGFDEPRTHIWVPKSHQKDLTARPPRVQLHETRRWRLTDCADEGLPRSCSAVAVVQGALWARSLKQGALVMTMSIQQRIVSADDVLIAFERVRRDARRRPLLELLDDIRGGIESMPELDLARLCRAYGVPEPTRQVRRRTSQGVAVVDAVFEEFAVAVEIQGAGHAVLDRMMLDEVRFLELALRGDITIPVSSATLRVDPHPFMAGLARLLRARGWRGNPTATSA
jgi:hypothetical protein